LSVREKDIRDCVVFEQRIVCTCWQFAGKPVMTAQSAEILSCKFSSISHFFGGLPMQNFRESPPYWDTRR